MNMISLIKLEKEKHDISINQINKIKNKLFPNNVLQERTDNFIAFYLNHGNKFIETLIKEMLKNFENVKLNSCGPDGISPILTKHIKTDEDKIKIIKEAIG